MKTLSNFSILLAFVLQFFVAVKVVSQSFADSLLTQKGGIFQKPVTVSSKLDSVLVFYTIDGTEPTSSSTLLKGNLTIQKTTAVRFKAYSKGKVIGFTTQTYIIGRTFDMAVVSIAVNPDDFFGFERGIYVKGCCAAQTPPYQGANFWKSWERAANIEFYEPSGKQGFNQIAGIRIFGGFSKGWPMKSLAIIAREKYGTKNFKYKIFPNKDIKKYKSFVLRNSGGDFNKTHFRDAFMTDLVEPLDMEIQAYRPAVVYINGEYWGIHNIREKITEHFIESNCGVDKDSIDLMRHRGDAQFGTSKDYKKLLTFLQNNTFESNEKIQELNTWMDIDNYINYNITEIFVDNRDAGGNIRYWKERKPGARWRWIFYDTDLSFGISDWKAYKVNTLKQMTSANTEAWPNPAWSTFIIRKLLENDSLKQVYSNRFSDHLNTIFHPKNVIFKIDSIQNLIRNEMPYHVVKWPTLTIKSWEKNVQVLRDFAANRPQALRGFIMEKFGWTDTVYVGLGEFDAKQGSVGINSLILKESFYGWYFAGCPIVIEALPNFGYEFVKWEGLSFDEPLITVDPKYVDSVFYPVFKKKVDSNHVSELKINEVSCKQDSLLDSGDWIELFNSSKTALDISNWKITNRKNEVFEFPEGTVMAAHSFLVIARSTKKIVAVFEDLNTSVLLQEKLSFKISSKAESLYVFDKDENVVDSLVYDLTVDLPDYEEYSTIVLAKVNPNSKSIFSSFELIETATPGSENSNFEELVDTSGRIELMDLLKENALLVGLFLGGILTLVLAIILFKKRNKSKSKKVAE